MARGLPLSWKQLIYFEFDQTVTTEILSDIIVGLEHSAINVVAVVSDLRGRNTLWRGFSVTVGQH